MQETRKSRPARFRWITNILMVGALIFLMFSPDAKSWVLRLFLSLGLFQAEVPEGVEENFAPADITFTASGRDRQSVSLNTLKGKTVFINFWATWCPPCRAEMPSMQAMYNKLKDDSTVVFLFVSEDENPDKAREYFSKNRFTMPLHFRSSSVSKEVFSGTLPTTVILDKNGKLVMKHEGIANYDTKEFIAQLKALQHR